MQARVGSKRSIDHVICVDSSSRRYPPLPAEVAKPIVITRTPFCGGLDAKCKRMNHPPLTVDEYKAQTSGKCSACPKGRV